MEIDLFGVDRNGAPDGDLEPGRVQGWIEAQLAAASTICVLAGADDVVGQRTMRVTVVKESQRARSFYERLGRALRGDVAGSVGATARDRGSGVSLDKPRSALGAVR